MDQMTKLFKALSDRNRLRIVGVLLYNNELCACKIIDLLKVSGATISNHLSILISSNIVLSRKDGRWVHYRLNRESNSEIIDFISEKLALDSTLKSDLEFIKNRMQIHSKNECKNGAI